MKEYAARGTYIYPPKQSMRIITDIFEWCSKELPKWNTISISGYHIREAGSTAVQEVAFTLSNGKAYLKAALDRGLDINVFGKRLSFFSMPIIICLKKLPSFVQQGECGQQR